MTDILDHLLGSVPPPAPASVEACFERYESCPFEVAIDRALWAGFEADRLGYAFLGGYQAALARLFAQAGRARPGRTSLAATESGGPQPSAIQTRLEVADGKWLVTGEKTYATLASKARDLLVVASRGRGPDGRNQLVLVRIAADAPGVTIQDRPPIPFAPEIPHSTIKLGEVAVSEEDVLPGDGYALYLKPFRTIEDTYVLAATLGYLLRTVRQFRFDEAVAEGTLGLVLALRELSAMPLMAVKTHLALAGVLQLTKRLIEDHDPEWEKAAPEVRERWRRDLPLLGVAGLARQQRTEAAWRTLRAPG